MVISENLAVGNWQLALGNGYGNGNGKAQKRTST